MKYFLIAGEASGDLHGSHLIEAIAAADPQAEFRFLGGDLMAAAAATEPIIHYRDMAYMGLLEVVRHLPGILLIMRTAREAIAEWKPDTVVLIDYPSFNLKIARFAHERGIRVCYFISPKVWVWKQRRVKDIRRHVDTMCCILPFEPAWYSKHGYTATYVGNPTVEEIDRALGQIPPRAEFCSSHRLDPDRPVIALLPGSRVREINDNLPIMLAAAERHTECQLAVSAAPNIDRGVYDAIIGDRPVTLVEGATWSLVRHARLAVVTSGTATLETALLNTPQIACYRMGGSRVLYNIYRRILKVSYVTLPNLIAGQVIIPELLMHNCTADAVAGHIDRLIADTPERAAQLDNYRSMRSILGDSPCAATAARCIVDGL